MKSYAESWASRTLNTGTAPFYPRAVWDFDDEPEPLHWAWPSETWFQQRREKLNTREFCYDD